MFLKSAHEIVESALKFFSTFSVQTFLSLFIICLGEIPMLKIFSLIKGVVQGKPKDNEILSHVFILLIL